MEIYMLNKKKKEKNTYGIVGLGRFGMALALELAGQDAELVVIDKCEEKVRELREYTENAFVVNNLDKKTLEETGIQNCDVVIVCIGEQIDVSILTTLNLKSLGVKTVISKASSTEHGEILEKLGADVIYPERDIALRLAHRLEANSVLDFIQLSEKLNISKFIVAESFEGKTVRDVNIRGEYGVNIIAIESGKNIIENISPDYAFQKGDILFVCGSRENLNKLEDVE